MAYGIYNNDNYTRSLLDYMPRIERPTFITYYVHDYIKSTNAQDPPPPWKRIFLKFSILLKELV